MVNLLDPQEVEFLHYSEAPVELDMGRKFEGVEPQLEFFGDEFPSGKPKGFWLSPGEEWRDFMLSQYPDYVDRVNSVARVTLKPTAKIVVLPSGKITMSGVHSWDFHTMDSIRARLEDAWEALRLQGYHGIYISNPGTIISSVYGMWEIASACIWDMEAVESVEWLPDATTAEERETELRAERHQVLEGLERAGFRLHPSCYDWVYAETEVAA